MKPKIYTALLIALYCMKLAGLAQTAQKHAFGHYFYFDFVTTDTRMMVRQPSTFTAQDDEIYRAIDFKVPNEHSVDKDIEPRSPIMLGVKLNPNLEDYYSAPVKSLSKEYSSYIIKDSSEAVLVALGITQQNVKDYRYRVIENDSLETTPWSKIPRLEQAYGAKQLYGFIGKFKAPGKQLLVEVVNVKNYSIRDGVVFDWRINFKPIVAEIMVSVPEKKDDSKIKTYIPADKIKYDYFNLSYLKQNRGFATRFDPATGLPLNLKFPVDSVTGLRFTFKDHSTVSYSIYIRKTIAGKTDTTLINIYTLAAFYDIESKYFNQPGKYEIIIQRTEVLGYWSEDQVLRIPFEVKPPPVLDKKVSIKQALPYIIATLTGVVLLFGGYYRRNQVKLLRAAQEKQTAGLKLQSIRAQLNPHFMFNALTSIQNLVNKNDIAGANHYLSKFAGLTRQVLDTGNEELLSLKQELDILDDYLQMEQLRFGFKYEINVDAALNKANTEIPAMLLQPFVENAVKHGVAVLKEQGNIEIAVSREAQDIIFTIKDNGKWSAPGNSAQISGYGLKLSQERVALLNQLYNEQPVSLHIDKSGPGTVVSIRLSNWI